MINYFNTGSVEAVILDVKSVNPNEAACTDAGIEYLVDTTNRFLTRPISRELVIENFAGLRPIIKSKGSHDFSTVSHNARINVTGKVINVFWGGEVDVSDEIGQKK